MSNLISKCDAGYNAPTDGKCEKCGALRTERCQAWRFKKARALSTATRNPEKE